MFEAKCRRAGVVRSSLPSFHQSQPRIVPHPGPKPPCHLHFAARRGPRGQQVHCAVPELSESRPPQRTPLWLASHVLVRDLAEKGEIVEALCALSSALASTRCGAGEGSPSYIFYCYNISLRRNPCPPRRCLLQTTRASMYRPSEQPTLHWPGLPGPVVVSGQRLGPIRDCPRSAQCESPAVLEIWGFPKNTGGSSPDQNPLCPNIDIPSNPRNTTCQRQPTCPHLRCPDLARFNLA